MIPMLTHRNIETITVKDTAFADSIENAYITILIISH